MRVVVSTQGSCSNGIWRLDPKPSPRAHSFTICISRTLQYHYIASLRIPGMVGAFEKTYLCEDIKRGSVRSCCNTQGRGYIVTSHCGQLSFCCIRPERRLFVAQLAYTLTMQMVKVVLRQGSCSSAATSSLSGLGNELQLTAECPLWRSNMSWFFL